MTKHSKLNSEYFEMGKDWFYDRYEASQVQANRWFLAFIGASCAVVALTICLTVLLPLKTLVPLVVHQNKETGEVWINKPKTPFVPETDAQTQADIVRYVASRESYSGADINQRFHLVMLLSNSTVGKNYANDQSNSNKSAPVNVLGREGTRSVQVEDIVFIDKAGTQELRRFKNRPENLAKVDFVTTTTDASGMKKNESCVATIGWVYEGIPQNQQDAWDNWNGFKVTTYRVDPRNINTTKLN